MLRWEVLMLIAVIRPDPTRGFCPWDRLPAAAMTNCLRNYTRLTFDRDGWAVFRQRVLRCGLLDVATFDNTTAYNFCYPLNVKFVTCAKDQLRRVGDGAYTFVPATGSVVISAKPYHSNSTVRIGFYSFLPDKTVTFCASEQRTCGILSDLEFETTGNRVYVPSLDRNFTAAEVASAGNDTVDVCYPLSPVFQQCFATGHTMMLAPGEYIIGDDRVLTAKQFIIQNMRLEPGDYMTMDYDAELDASAVFCYERTTYGLLITLRDLMAKLSICCLIITILINWVVLRSNFHKTALQVHAAFLLLTTVVYLNTEKMKKLDVYYGLYCSLIHLVEAYSYLEAFFWLQTMTIDMWLNVTDKRGHWVWLANMKKRWLHLLYAAYALLTPAAFEAIPFIYDWTYSDRTGCVKVTKHGLLFSCLLPESYSYLVNTVFIILTIVKLSDLAKHSAFANANVHKQMIVVYIKLLVASGLCVIIPKYVLFNDPSQKISLIVSWLSHLQGVFVFIIHTCNKTVCSKLSAKIQKRIDGVIEWFTWADRAKKGSQSQKTSTTSIPDFETRI